MTDGVTLGNIFFDQNFVMVREERRLVVKESKSMIGVYNQLPAWPVKNEAQRSSENGSTV